MAQVKRTVLQRDGEIQLVYTTTDGSYLGRIRVEGVDERALRIAAHDFKDWLEEQDRPQLAVVQN